MNTAQTSYRMQYKYPKDNHETKTKIKSAGNCFIFCPTESLA